MTKDVLISITGLQFAQGDTDVQPLEMVIAGEYYKKNGKHYLLYEEINEGFEEKTHNMIKFDHERMEVNKKGLIQVQMIFEQNKKNISRYQTPFGMFQMGIATTEIRLSETEDLIQARVDYALDFNDGFAGDCNIFVRVQPRKGGQLKLTE